MLNFFANLKKQVVKQERRQSQFYVPSCHEFPEHLDESQGDEDGFCVVGQTVSESSEVTSDARLLDDQSPPSYTYIVSSPHLFTSAFMLHHYSRMTDSDILHVFLKCFSS